MSFRETWRRFRAWWLLRQFSPLFTLWRILTVPQLTDEQIAAIGDNLKAKRDARATANNAWHAAEVDVTNAQNELASANNVASAKQSVFNDLDDQYDTAVDEAIAVLTGSKIND
jgi:hypothetical protein